MRARPTIVDKFGIWLYLKTPTTVVAIIQRPAKDAYVIPIGITFITFDSPYIQRIIVIALRREGMNIVKPSADFAKLFDAVPTTTAKVRNKYAKIRFIKLCNCAYS